MEPLVAPLAVLIAAVASGDPGPQARALPGATADSRRHRGPRKSEWRRPTEIADEHDATVTQPPDRDAVMARAETFSAVASLELTVDHVRGPAGGRVILEYGDYQCPYSRAAYRAIQRVERRTGDSVGFAFRHFPLTAIHPHALAAATAAEAAALQGRFWEMTDVLFQRQKALADGNLRDYAAELGLDLARFDADRMSRTALARIRRDVDSGLASRQVRGTPTLFVDGVLHQGAHDTATLLAAIET